MSVRIYKDNLRQPLFRTLLFTDFVIFIIIGAGIAGVTFLIFKLAFGNFNYLTYLFMLGILEPAFIVIATLRIDNQQIYKILSRALIFTFTRKQFRGQQLGSYYNDFSIQDGLVVRKKSISKVFSINPYDISALNENEKLTFFANIKQALHILPSQLQVIVRKEIANAQDFTDHFLYIYKSIPKKNSRKEVMVGNYQRDLLSFVETENLQIIKQYGVFALNTDTANITEKVQAIGKLEDMYLRFSTALEACHISTKRLTNADLEAFMRRLLR